MTKQICALLLLACLIGSRRAPADQQPSGNPLTLQPNDRIVFVGNTFAERFRHFGYFETLLTTRFPELHLTFRNLGWSADEVALRPRPLNFGDIHTHLTNQSADVIFACFGANESFQGEAGLEVFERDLRGLIGAMLTKRYNGESPPRIVLIEPIPQEQIGLLPDPAQRNDQIRRYGDVMERVARDLDITFLPLFDPVAAVMADGPPLTFNGIHLTEYGYWVVSQLMMEQLGLLEGAPTILFQAKPVRVAAEGFRLSIETLDPERMKGEFTLPHLPVPPPPGAAESSTAPFTPARPRLDAEFLVPGRYTFAAAGAEPVTRRAGDWADAPAIPFPQADEIVKSLRQAIVYKDQLFFDRWRAVNGYYIYGGRKEPFGVISFPPEMDRFDERIADFDARIHELSAPPAPQQFTFERTGE